MEDLYELKAGSFHILFECAILISIDGTLKLDLGYFGLRIVTCIHAKLDSLTRVSVFVTVNHYVNVQFSSVLLSLYGS